MQKYAEYVEDGTQAFLPHVTCHAMARGNPPFSNRSRCRPGVLVGDPNALGGYIGLKENCEA